MSTPKRILVVASAVTPFVEDGATAALARSVAEHLHANSAFDARVMMPRYGTISGRTHNLHEVIRLSGTEVPVGGEAHTITTQVASLPETRLQVYFMGDDAYFDREGVVADADGAPYDDNAARALFFGRAVLATVKKLRWGPDVIHAFGWAGSLVPMLLRTDYAGDDLFAQARSIYTPDHLETGPALTDDFAAEMGLEPGDAAQGLPLAAAGRAWADAVVHPPAADASETERFSAEAEARAEQIDALYEQMLSQAVA